MSISPSSPRLRAMRGYFIGVGLAANLGLSSNTGALAAICMLSDEVESLVSQQVLQSVFSLVSLYD
ncbi:hypothetical protein [Veronia nyctiphanis]|uniref:hypothetical protein n=1 Tax=Veronia nyctiphanis TaxID=1278244 RepID=UPI001F1F37A8|nr:hypothetical protein [Veronia nyctiphanis]